MNTHDQNRPGAQDRYDYNNKGLPRNFDIRLEVAEQKEILSQRPEPQSAERWHCSDYDF